MVGSRKVWPEEKNKCGWGKVTVVDGDDVLRETDEVYSLSNNVYKSAVIPSGVLRQLPINHSDSITVECKDGTRIIAKYKDGKIVSATEE